jgi:HSP20 family protein
MVNQWDEFDRFEEMMNRMFESFWGSPRRRFLPVSRLLPSGEKGEIIPSRQREPSVDILETEKEIIATAEMPGLDKKDINIDLTQDRLEISTETKQEEKKEEKGYSYREIRTGSYYRALSLPSPVDTDKSRASYENGVLKIEMPKTEIKEKKQLSIE